MKNGLWFFSTLSTTYLLVMFVFFAQKKKKTVKFLNFIKFSQNGHKESASTEKRAKKNAVVTEC